MPTQKPFWKLAAIVGAFAVFGVASHGQDYAQPSQRAEVVKSMSNAKQLGLACKLYAADHAGSYPPSLYVLFPVYVSTLSILISPLKPEEPEGYNYTPGLKDTSPPDKILIEDKFAPSVAHQRIVVYTNDNACVLPMP